ncbi:cryptochrome/photolyase family protein [Paucihalobacter ruber]|uniref:Cryptochrome/photolyase family protein n=1 Tax=Paucihalobacter ruber TaxID=2567861 RepID=A0A506PJE5_9FLAO|nr:cryptochrome/photolyase family protein [Paucihalobacter ruber]TPV33202.1 cryptochrome/photolyase family protein [Paucihalobacter ruber]
MTIANLIFPHQLFKESPLFKAEGDLYLVEVDLFFTQYKFHKQKIAFHRSSMKQYEAFLKEKGIKTHYIEAVSELSDVRLLLRNLKEYGLEQINYIDPTDDWLSRRLISAAAKNEIILNKFENPLFINTTADLSGFFQPKKKKFFQTAFYKDERLRLVLLITANSQPEGGKWTYDDENRKKYPAKQTPPNIEFPEVDSHYEEAVNYVDQYFSSHFGKIGKTPLYPTNFSTAQDWFDQFLKHRFKEFGPYEDAIVKEEIILNHSLLSPLINVGLLSPKYVVETTIEFAEKHNIPLNSTEGFVRQIIGWREFIRGIYEVKGREERTKNFWNFKRKIPKSFYDGSTGIEPVDDSIKKVLKTGYTHHIERLMILGNFMLLCEFDPDEVYRWFMEMYIDAYDWVMVPNVYGMSQFADGGLMSTKPYISGSNYVIKMSNYKKGAWQDVWDGLFWNFMDKNREFFLSNPRLGMLIRTFDKMSKDKQLNHLNNAQRFLKTLDEQ